jgi:Virulence activator alpha C-term
MLLRIFFAYLVDPDEVEAFLRREADHRRSRLAVLEAFAAETATTPSERASELTVHAGIGRLKAEIEWAEWAASEVRKW